MPKDVLAQQQRTNGLSAPVVREKIEPSNLSLFVLKKVYLHNSEVFTSQEVNEIVKDYLGKPVDLSDLLKIQELLSQNYLKKGYFLSRVRLETQNIDVDKGVAYYSALEESVDLQIQSHGLRRSYISARIKRFLHPPLSQKNLYEAINLLRQNPLIEDLKVDLWQTEGNKSILSLDIKAAPQWNLSSEANTDENDDVGASGILVSLLNRNLAGGGESILTEYKVTEGLERWLISLSIPVNSKEGRIELAYQQANSQLINGFFEPFDIRNDSSIVSVGFSQPLILTPNSTFELGLSIEQRESRSFVLDDILFSQAELSALRFKQVYLKRSTQDALIGISQLSLGWVNFNQGQENNSNFFHWQGQLQWERNLNNANTKFYVRLASQMASKSLPPFEGCAIGGRNGDRFSFGNNNRAYTTNGRIGDSCLAATMELRFPVYVDDNGQLQLVLFGDLGYVWNLGAQQPLSPQFLASTGVGFRYQLNDSLLVQVNYAIPLSGVGTLTGDSLKRQEVSGSVRYGVKF
ncbi:ShlB/FhaC/HecB family hemolysin secretion/activation protein [Gloeothece citriformis]|nr:BamA/TamA family outer membrane protein [Gloeothece citriformis]